MQPYVEIEPLAADRHGIPRMRWGLWCPAAASRLELLVRPRLVMKRLASSHACQPGQMCCPLDQCSEPTASPSSSQSRQTEQRLWIGDLQSMSPDARRRSKLEPTVEPATCAPARSIRRTKFQAGCSDQCRICGNPQLFQSCASPQRAHKTQKVVQGLRPLFRRGQVHMDLACLVA